MVIQTGHQLQALATGLDELLAATVADFFEGLDAVGDEGRAQHRQAPDALIGQLDDHLVGVDDLDERPAHGTGEVLVELGFVAQATIMEVLAESYDVIVDPTLILKARDVLARPIED